MYFKIQATAYNIFTSMLCLCTTKMSHIAYFIALRNYSDKMLFTKMTKTVENISMGGDTDIQRQKLTKINIRTASTTFLEKINLGQYFGHFYRP